MNIYKRQYLFIAALTFALLPFQNCSEVNFQPDAANYKADLGTDIPELNDGYVDPDDLVGTTDTNNEEEQNNNEEENNNGDVVLGSDLTEEDLIGWDEGSPDLEEEVTQEEEEVYENELLDYHAECQMGSTPVPSMDMLGNDLRLNNVRGLTASHNVNTLLLNNIRGTTTIDDVNLVASVNNIRGLLRVSGNNALSINNLRGVTCVTANSVKSVNNIRGVQVFINPSDSLGNMASLNNSRGILYLENMTLNRINNFRGVIILNNSTILKMNNVNAVIKQADGSGSQLVQK